MRTLFKICIWICITCTITIHAQDTTVYKREYQNKVIDTCANRIIPLNVGCGHPAYYLQMCDGHTLEKLQIYNRWGLLVHETTNSRNYVEMRDKNGSLLSQGVYYYIVKYKTRSSELKTDTGFFTYIP